MNDVDKLREAIAALEKQFAHQIHRRRWLGIGIDAGWLPIVRALFMRIDRELTPFERKRLRWVQIKQKWGELRAYFYLDGKQGRLHIDIMAGNEHAHIVQGKEEPLAAKVDRIIAEVAEEASRTCEICGEPGRKVNNGGWIMVACPKHEGKSLVHRAPSDEA